MICVYCAFNRFKTSPNLEIKEIPLKCNEIIKDLEEMIKDNKQYAQALENYYPNLKKNREEEEQKIKNFFEKLLESIQEKYSYTLDNLSKFYSEDGKILTDKLEQTAKKLEIAETIKYSLEEVIENKGIDVASVLDAYLEFSRNYQNKGDYSTNIREYKYSNEFEPNKLFRLVDDFTIIKTKTKQISLAPRYNDNNNLGKRSANPLNQKSQYVNSYNQGNYIVNTSQNDYNNIICTEDYFGDKKVLRMSNEKSYQVTASRSGRNE